MVAKAFTIQYSGIIRQIITPAKIFQASVVAGKEVFLHESKTSLWDTGATGTVINTVLASNLNLKPIDITTVIGVNGSSQQNVYIIDIVLPNNVKVKNVNVTSGKLGNDIDLLIGMNIIGLGDFAISQAKGSSTFSFQYPASPKAIDFVKQINSKAEKKGKFLSRNSPFGKNYFK